MWRVFLLSCGILAFAVPAFGDTYIVHPDGTGDFPTIQAAIDAVVDGDVIELTNGVFIGNGNRDIDFLGKAITVRSQSGDAEACVIDCQGSETETHRGFWFRSGEDSDAVLDGVTITGGHLNGDSLGWIGGGVLCSDDSSPTLSDCVFLRNHAGLGGGVFCDGTSPTVAGCLFRENSVDFDGGGMDCHDGSTALITHCTFISNSGPMGGGMQIISAYPLLENCSFYGNSGALCGGVYCHGDAAPELRNIIIAFCAEGPAVYCSGTSSATLTCCDIYGNEGGDWVGCIADQYGVNGNICEDPLFCDPENGDFTLECTSPCAPFSPPNPECDLIGAWPVGCGGTPTTRSTWGGVKALFRR
jgi:hypothetical protein